MCGNSVAFAKAGNEFILVHPFTNFNGGVAQSVYCLATDWTTERYGLDLWQGQRIFPLASVSRPALGPIQPPVQWVPEVLSSGEITAGA
jgi:hypothetical protein